MCKLLAIPFFLQLLEIFTEKKMDHLEWSLDSDRSFPLVELISVLQLLQRIFLVNETVSEGTSEHLDQV